uniref:Uncharacterized protein n=1 Tax=Setaria italica TaxID=4555 RepID=K3Z183_SETIT
MCSVMILFHDALCIEQKDNRIGQLGVPLSDGTLTEKDGFPSDLWMLLLLTD